MSKSTRAASGDGRVVRKPGDMDHMIVSYVVLRDQQAIYCIFTFASSLGGPAVIWERGNAGASEGTIRAVQCHSLVWSRAWAAAAGHGSGVQMTILGDWLNVRGGERALKRNSWFLAPAVRCWGHGTALYPEEKP